MAEALRPVALGGVAADRSTTNGPAKVKTATRTVEVRRPLHSRWLSASPRAPTRRPSLASPRSNRAPIGISPPPSSPRRTQPTFAAEHDRIGDRLTRAASTYDAAAAAYDDVAAQLDRLENGLHELADPGQGGRGSAAWVAPPAARLPVVSRSARRRRAARRRTVRAAHPDIDADVARRSIARRRTRPRLRRAGDGLAAPPDRGRTNGPSARRHGGPSWPSSKPPSRRCRGSAIRAISWPSIEPPETIDRSASTDD